MHPEMANLGSIPENAKNKPIKVVGDKKVSCGTAA
jgi:hypothetical protein